MAVRCLGYMRESPSTKCPRRKSLEIAESWTLDRPPKASKPGQRIRRVRRDRFLLADLATDLTAARVRLTAVRYERHPLPSQRRMPQDSWPATLIDSR